jgi:hypothetical protein
MADEDVDLSSLDRPEVLRIAFSPRKSPVKPQKPNTKNYFIEVEKGVKIGCRFHTRRFDYPSLLYFHGNATIVDDLDQFAPFYNKIGINLFVASYRGYGLSDGTPTITNLIKDSHRIFEECRKIVEENDFRKSLFVMGRSIGSIPAAEIAYHYQDDIQGLIIESGPANNLRQYIRGLIPLNHPIWSDEWEFLNKVKLRSIYKPTLIIHAEHDNGIPLEEARELYDNSAAKDKRLKIIPNADHNNLMIIGKQQYYKAIQEFTKTYS